MTRQKDQEYLVSPDWAYNQARNLTCDDQDFIGALNTVSVAFTPAFVHGLLTAYCCQTDNPHGWIGLLFAETDVDDAAQIEALKVLNQYKNQIAEELADSELGFQLFVEDTDISLYDAVFSTREWASGYWLGIDSAAIAKTLVDDAYCTEFFADLPTVAAMPLPEVNEADATWEADDTNGDSYRDAYDDSGDIYDDDGDNRTHADLIEVQTYCQAGAIGVFLASWQD